MFCADGFYLTEDFTCELKKCTCSNGVAAEGTDCPMHNTEFCMSCDEPGGYVLENNKCHRRHCTCEHGKERWGLPCTIDGEHQCASCDAGFALKPPAAFDKITEHGQTCAGHPLQIGEGDSKY
ncbi:unnamed protein product, partial [Amoebophrya sp. A120]